MLHAEERESAGAGTCFTGDGVGNSVPRESLEEDEDEEEEEEGEEEAVEGTDENASPITVDDVDEAVEGVTAQVTFFPVPWGL